MLFTNNKHCKKMHNNLRIDWSNDNPTDWEKVWLPTRKISFGWGKGT